MKGKGMLVVSLRGVNFRFWSNLRCSGQNTIIFSRKGLFQGCTGRNIKHFNSCYLLDSCNQSMVSFRSLFQNFQRASPPLSCGSPPGAWNSFKYTAVLVGCTSFLAILDSICQKDRTPQFCLYTVFSEQYQKRILKQWSDQSHYGRETFKQNFRKFRCKTQWIEVRSNRKSFDKTGRPFQVDHFSRSDRSEILVDWIVPILGCSRIGT